MRFDEIEENRKRLIFFFIYKTHGFFCQKAGLNAGVGFVDSIPGEMNRSAVLILIDPAGRATVIA